MKTNRPLGRLGFTMAAAVALSAAAMMTACGKLKSENIPTSTPSLTLEVTNAEKDSEGRYSIRANGKNTLEVVATVTGLSSSVGFYLPATWATFSGGTTFSSSSSNTATDNSGPSSNTTDLYTYYTADSSGKARAIFTPLTTGVGRIDLLVKSLDVEVSLPLSFEFATLTIFPATLMITDPSAPGVYLYARGGLPPIEWFISDPRTLGYHVVDDTTIEVFVSDPAAFTSQTITVTARDAEGQTASSTITLGSTTACTASTIAVTPTSVSFTIGSAPDLVVSITVTDPNNTSATSVSVGYTAPNSSGTLTLTQWGSPGVFQYTQTVLGSEFDGWLTGNIQYAYSGTDTACQPKVVTGNIALTGTL